MLLPDMRRATHHYRHVTRFGVKTRSWQPLVVFEALQAEIGAGWGKEREGYGDCHRGWIESVERRPMLGEWRMIEIMLLIWDEAHMWQCSITWMWWGSEVYFRCGLVLLFFSLWQFLIKQVTFQLQKIGCLHSTNQSSIIGSSNAVVCSVLSVGMCVYKIPGCLSED